MTAPIREAARSTKRYRRRGEVAEWSNVPHSKCGVPGRVPWVRIPPSPPPSWAGSLAQQTGLQTPDNSAHFLPCLNRAPACCGVWAAFAACPRCLSLRVSARTRFHPPNLLCLLSRFSSVARYRPWWANSHKRPRSRGFSGAARLKRCRLTGANRPCFYAEQDLISSGSGPVFWMFRPDQFATNPSCIRWSDQHTGISRSRRDCSVNPTG